MNSGSSVRSPIVTLISLSSVDSHRAASSNFFSRSASVTSSLYVTVGAETLSGEVTKHALTGSAP